VSAWTLSLLQTAWWAWTLPAAKRLVALRQGFYFIVCVSHVLPTLEAKAKKKDFFF
jgi:hypothetical protein